VRVEFGTFRDMSDDEAAKLRREEEAARQRLRETEVEAGETLEEAEELDEPNVHSEDEQKDEA
jgi:hypothetical protein